MIKTDAVLYGVKTNNKKQLLQNISDAFSELTNINSDSIMECIYERERLGSTGMGRGIAIPHARIEGIDRVYIVLATLQKPIEFQSIDEKPVDIVCALLAPEDAGADHLQALARVSRYLRQKTFCAKLRGANSKDAVQAILLNETQSMAA